MSHKIASVQFGTLAMTIKATIKRIAIEKKPGYQTQGFMTRKKKHTSKKRTTIFFSLY